MTGWEAFRAGFPLLKDQIYLAAAGGCPISRGAADAAQAYYSQSVAQGDAPFGDWLAQVDAVRGQVAELLSVPAAHVGFVAHASAAMNIATQYVPMGAHVLAVEGEFPSVTQPFLARGCEVSFVPQDDSPHDAIAAALRPETAAIAMSHVQYQSGRRYDLEVLRALAGDARLLFVDATQSVGAVSVAAGGADMLTASHYKWLCAGYGAGLVTLSERLLQRPSPVFGWRSHADPYALDERDATPHPGAQRLEMGHPPFAPVLALGGALSHLAQTVQDPWPRIAHLQSHLRAEMARLGLAPPTTPEGHSGIAVIPADDPAGLKAALAQRGIMASARAGSVRLSTHAFNSEDDVSAAVHALAELSQA